MLHAQEVLLQFLALSLPLIEAPPLAGFWPRAQEPQTTDPIEDASRAEREERRTTLVDASRRAQRRDARMDFVETQAQATPEVAEDFAAPVNCFQRSSTTSSRPRCGLSSRATPRGNGASPTDLEEKFLSKVKPSSTSCSYDDFSGSVVGAVDSTVITAQEGIERLKKAVEDKLPRAGPN